MKPLIASNTVTDEIERANLFKMNGKWYLFTDSRGSKMTIDGIGSKDIYMLGYVSGSLTGPFKPLNKSGLVLHMDQDYNDITFTYSHFAVPQKKATKSSLQATSQTEGFRTSITPRLHQAFAEDQRIKTSVVKNSILEQGQLTVNK